ncbi:hypothetical protein METP3_01778 [Methanosarcinales archaeon]|nr:hypothetical protein METP3_01778 [Methanosarcinales archaeon]
MDIIFFKDKKYSLKTLELLTGKMDVDIEKIHDNILIMAQVVDDPDKLPYFLETIKSLEIDDIEKFRFVLLRVQIDSQLHLNENIEKYHKRLFVSQIIEKLIYGELLLEAGKEDKEDDEED